MMPQKKNPQIAEHVRGRAAVAIGRLTALLGVIKGLPLSYNSDLQEDKELVFAQVDGVRGSLDVLGLAFAGIRFDGERMAAAAGDGLTVATDVAEALVRGGTPFRQAHEQVADAHRRGRAVHRPDARGGDRGARRGGHAGPLHRPAGGARGAHRRLARPRRPVSTQLLPDAATVVSGALVLGGVPADRAGARGSARRCTSTTPPRCAPGRRPTPSRSHRAAAAPMFALKANGTPGVLRILREAGLGADVASAGEIALALAAGFTGADLVVHGNAKGEDDLAAALDAGAALVVLDAPEEAAALARNGAGARRRPGRAGAGHARYRRRHAPEDPDRARGIEVRARPGGGARARHRSARRPPRHAACTCTSARRWSTRGRCAPPRRGARGSAPTAASRPTCSTSAAVSAWRTRRASRRPIRAPTPRRWRLPCRPRSTPSACRRHACCWSPAARSSPSPA